MRLRDRGSMIVTATTTALLLAACTANGSSNVASTHSSSSSRSGSASPAGACTDTTVRKLADQFVQAFNAGDQPTLHQLWAEQGSGFDWYSTDAPGQRIRSAAKDRAGLERYFAARHAAGESLRVTSFQFNGNAADYGNFQYTLIRRADDLAPTAYTGKGAAICGSTRSRLGVWSMAKWPTPRTSGSSTPSNGAEAQVAEVSHVTSFIHAYNAGDLQGALAQFSRTQALGFSDCNYASQQLVDGHGRVQLTAWLRRNFAQHDQLIIGDIAGANPGQPLGVLGVSFSRRSSDAIARAGHPNGITPTTAAKVKFDHVGLITEFNNGPYGGPPDSCHLS